MMCERCKNPNKTDTQNYKLYKANATGGETSRAVTLCDECAGITRATHRLSGGKAAEAQPSPSESEVAASEPEREANEEPAKRRRY